MLTDLVERVRALVFGRRWSRDLSDEMRFHVDQDVAARVRAGADPATARREALLAFGGVERFQEETRDSTGVRPLQDLTADVRFALRSLRRNPGFTATATGVLAIAIGATAAVFCVVHAVLLADLPYPHPDRLVRIYNQNSPTNIWSLSVVDVQALREDHRSFDTFGALRFASFALSGAGEPEQLRGARVSSGFFSGLGVHAEFGRLTSPSDEASGAPPVVVVTDDFARSHFGTAPGAVGKTLNLDGVPSSIVGVLPRGVDDLAGFRSPVWASLKLPIPTRRGPFGYVGIARLKPGVTPAEAGQELRALAGRVFTQWQASFQDQNARYSAFELQRTIIGDSDRQLTLFAGAVVLVLLVAIANVATLMLVRGTARAHELAVRATLGASRPRLARLVIAECLVLTAGATVAGLGLAALAVRGIGSIAPDLPRADAIAVDLPTILVAIGVGIGAGLLISISPVAGVLRGSLAEWKSDARRSGGTREAHTIRGILVAAEFALAVPLLLAAALLGSSFLRLQEVDPGYNPDRGFSIALNLPASRYPDSLSVVAFWRNAMTRVTETPGVLAAGLTTSPPPDNGGDVNNFNLLAHPVANGRAEPVAPWPIVSPGFFKALDLSLLEGRLITDADTGATSPVIVVSRSWANHYFPNEPVIGQRLISGGCTTCPADVVVGVVGDVKYEGLAGSGEGVYTPFVLNGVIRNATLIVRTSASPESFMKPVTEALRGLDPQIPLAATPLRRGLRQALADPGRWTSILGAFAVTALGLSAIGIFGLMSYVVRRQRREIGVRLALGAEPRRIAGMIVGRGMRYVAAGTLVGLGLALLEARWIGALLYGVAPRDPTIILSVTVLLVGAALVACLLPGIRAARIRPLEAIAAD
ncbi:MAG TPA: ADOP family duplicated permease [Gemmatimonadales bacterium]|nr:ADOP family duplicated permease [Gemmatimonadales bacterium]